MKKKIYWGNQEALYRVSTFYTSPYTFRNVLTYRKQPHVWLWTIHWPHVSRWKSCSTHFYTDTCFSVATFFDDWNANYEQRTIQRRGMVRFCKELVSNDLKTNSFYTCTGYPNGFRTDRWSIFTFHRWKQLADMNIIQLCLTGVNAQSSLGIGQRYHEPLRRIYRKVQVTYLIISSPHVFYVSFKGINKTICEKGLIPLNLYLVSYLVFKCSVPISLTKQSAWKPWKQHKPKWIRSLWNVEYTRPLKRTFNLQLIKFINWGKRVLLIRNKSKNGLDPSTECIQKGEQSRFKTKTNQLEEH